MTTCTNCLIIQLMLKYICRDGATNVSEPSTEARRLALLLRVVSDPTRLAIFDLLIEGVQCNCEIGDQLGLPMNLISHHLKVLRDAGLVKAERDPNDARWVYYSIDESGLARLQARLASFFAPSRIRPRHPSCGPDGARSSEGLEQRHLTT